MDIITTTISGLEHKIKLLDQPITSDELTTNVEQLEEPVSLINEHEKIFSSEIYIPYWREIVLLRRDPNQALNLTSLDLIPGTSYQIQSARKNPTYKVPMVSVEAIIVTKDNKIVYGLRGGLVNPGKFNIVPAGHLSYNGMGEPVFNQVDQEIREELGIESGPVLMVGYQNHPEFTNGLSLIFFTTVNETSEEINEKHKAAYTLYTKSLPINFDKLNIKDRESAHIKAISQLKEKKYLNVDAWEHTSLKFIGMDEIDDIIDSRRITHEGNVYDLLDVGRGPLMLYRAMLKMN